MIFVIFIFLFVKSVVCFYFRISYRVFHRSELGKEIVVIMEARDEGERQAMGTSGGGGGGVGSLRLNSFIHC